MKLKKKLKIKDLRFGGRLQNQIFHMPRAAIAVVRMQ